VGDGPQRPCPKRRHPRGARASPGSLLIAEFKGRVIGALIATWDGWRGNLYRLAVREEHRRRGVALRLVQEGERRLAARGARRISVLAGRDDEMAAGLWTAAGYDRDEKIGRFVKDVPPTDLLRLRPAR
jgi:ribosomal protein S18 acetylase RimI-like enzyme